MNQIGANDKIYKGPSAGEVIGGVVIGGTVVGSLTKGVKHFVNKPIGQKFQEINESLSEDEFLSVKTATDKMFQRKELKDVELFRAGILDMDKIKSQLAKELKNMPFPKFIKEQISHVMAMTIAMGKNAVFVKNSKAIIIPEKELQLAVFHEAGHAINHSKFGFKAIQKMKPIGFLVAPISLIGLFKTKKAEGQKPESKIDKATTFVKENAGKLAFAAFIPKLLEEKIASVRGNKIAKELLSSKLAKKVSKTNSLAFITYLSLALASSVGLTLGIKAKDTLAKNVEVKK